MKKYRLKGSYTVEASFLMPMILTVIVVIIYLSFFLHDRAVLSSAAYTAALRGSQLINGEDVYARVEKNAAALRENRMLGTKNIQTDIQIGSSQITVSYSGELRIPAGTLLCRYLTGGKDHLSVEVSAKADRLDPVGFVRKCRIVEALAKGAKGKGKTEDAGEETPE
ncbi:MAG: pilus assembly protein [Lachnospiraceae bacterium]|nr:pilus assembly protein [Lachnospiraceae bacterium]